MLCVPSCEAFGGQGAEGAAPVAAKREVGKHTSCHSISLSNSILSAGGEGTVPLQVGHVPRAEVPWMW